MLPKIDVPYQSQFIGLFFFLFFFYFYGDRGGGLGVQLFGVIM